KTGTPHMMVPENEADDANFSELLSEFAAARTVGQGAAFLKRPSLSAALRARLVRAGDCLDLLAQVWPASTPAAVRVPPARLGRFLIERELGRGSFGVVYAARDSERNAQVALKHLFQLTPAVLARFKLSFRALADLLHPNLVLLHELMVQDEDWFLTMERI